MSSAKAAPLLQRTIDLLSATSKTYLEIYKATDLRPNWLAKLRQGKIKHPSVTRVQKLHDYLGA